MVWVAFAWVTRPLQREFFLSTLCSTYALFIDTESHAFAHLIFALSFGLCAYNFFRAMTLDPGTCPVPTSDAELKSVRSFICHASSRNIHAAVDY
jgi:palmitoyltransferase